ncbi:MAG: SDR family oxidoreductase [Pseudomonadota bacterium]
MNEPVTVITGTRKGIGRFLAQHYVAAGHRVIGCSRSENDYEDERYEHHCLDVADERAVKDLFRHIRKTHGGVTHLLNNAGIASMNHSLLTPASTVSKLLSTNVLGCFVFCREAAKLMRGKKYGRIVNFSTVAVPYKLEGEAVYVASKAAVEGLTNVLSREFGEFGVTVNTVAPVPIETDLIRAVPEDKIRALIDRQSVKRLGSFEDVANVTDFFLQPESEMVNGQHIYLGGA